VRHTYSPDLGASLSGNLLVLLHMPVMPVIRICCQVLYFHGAILLILPSKIGLSGVQAHKSITSGASTGSMFATREQAVLVDPIDVRLAFSRQTP